MPINSESDLNLASPDAKLSDGLLSDRAVAGDYRAGIINWCTTTR